MHTYERLSELRSDSIPELLVIDRFVNTLPQRCKEIYNDSEESKAQYHQQKISIQKKLKLHCNTMINVIPMYKWFLGDNLVDFGEECYELGIQRAIQEAHASKKLKGKILPIFKSNSKIEDIEYYNELVYNQISELDSSKIELYSVKDYIKFRNSYQKLLKLIRENDIENLDKSKLFKYVRKIDHEGFIILILEEVDDGSHSPFIIKRFTVSTIFSKEGEVHEISQGVCHHNPRVSGPTLMIPILALFIISIVTPIIIRRIGLISIPENCLDSMSYFIAPLAFLIGFIMPFVIKLLTNIIGLELPKGEVEIQRNYHLVILIVILLRLSPFIGMVAFCLKAKMYTEYLREKWFLVVVTIGGSLGNLAWLMLGMIIEMSYSGSFMIDSVMSASKNIIHSGYKGDLIDMSNISDDTLLSFSSDIFVEEANKMMLAGLSIFILNTTIFLFQSILFILYLSDIMCGRISKTTHAGFVFSLVGSTISYCILFFSFSCWNCSQIMSSKELNNPNSACINSGNCGEVASGFTIGALMHFIDFSNFKQTVINIIKLFFYISQFFMISTIFFSCNCRRKVVRKIDQNLVSSEEVIEDQEAKQYLISSNSKSMIKKLSSKYGIPFVGVHREIVKEIYQASSDEKSDHFFLYAISGRRGTGKTRIVYELFKKEERKSDFQVLQGDAGVKDDDKSKDMDLEDNENNQNLNVKIQKCQPFEPIRKAIGKMVGINVFSSPAQQLSMIKNATDFAESFNGLSFLFSVDNKEDEGESEDAKQMSDIHVLADSLSKILIKEARRYNSEEGKKLVLLFEDMEYADKNSLDFLRVIVKIFAANYKTIPIIIVICCREILNSDEGENNEKRISEIIKIANEVAKKTGGGSKMLKLVNQIIDKNNNVQKETHEIAKQYSLNNLDEDNLSQLLQSLCFVEEEIKDISKWLFSKTKGKLYWVSVCLQNLFMEKYVESSLRGWRVTPGKSLREIAIPNKMAQALELKFRKIEPECLKLLQIAAECGMSFNSNLLAKIRKNTRLEVIYQLNRIQEEYNIISENIGCAKRNDQGNDTLSSEFTFTSVVYVDAMKSLTRCYGNNLLP